MEEAYYKNKWESQYINKKFRKSCRYRTRKYYQTSNSSSQWIRAGGNWRRGKRYEQSLWKVQSRIQHKKECDKKCKNPTASTPNYIDYNINQFDSYDNNQSNQYVSVYLNDYINIQSTQTYEYDYDLQYAIMLSTKSKKQTNSNKNKPNNSFEQYWNEMQKDRKTFNKKLIRNIHRNNRTGMKNSIFNSVRKLLREYFTLCQQNNVANINDVKSVKKSQYSQDNFMAKTLKSLCPEVTFNIQKLGRFSPGSFSAKSFVFHGTDKKNINNILQKGLIIGGTKGVSMRNGSVYGNGVYCSPNIQTASGYSNGAIFVCYVSNANKFGDIWVVPNESQIVCCYLIRYNGGYLSSTSVGNSNSTPAVMRANDIAIFIPSLGKLNAPKKFRNRQRRFSKKHF